ncbi:MAG: DEAD/DEAH box helicase [Candidatus Thorarchaeota archaeon]
MDSGSDNKSLLPPYMNDSRHTGKYVGTLEYGKDYNGNYVWIVKAKPHVIMMIKRLFPSSRTGRKGCSYISDNRRLIADLNWLMQRYPLKIKDKERWHEAYMDAVDYVIGKELINKKRGKVKPSSDFKGELMDFQKQGLAYMLHNKMCILADEMGLGKTVQALALLSKNGKYPALIVVPPHLILQWKSEIHKFLGEDIDIHVINGLKPYPIPDADIYIIYYLVIRAWFDPLIEKHFDTIIFDECQELRRNQSQKYRAIRELVLQGQPKHSIGLSGTPIYNYYDEIYNVLEGLYPDSLGNSKYFYKEWKPDYDNPEFKGDWRLASIVKSKELGEYLMDEGLMLRRKKAEVLTELPPKSRSVQVIDLDKNLFIKMVSEQVSISHEILINKREPNQMMKLMNVVNNIRRASGIAKAQHVAEFVKPILEAGEPCLLYAHHHDVMDLYGLYLNQFDPLFLTGKVKTADKQKNVDSFMKGHNNLLCINLRTTAGLNLHRARCVVFGELDWSPAVHAQAEDRVHRIGQKNNVLAYYLIAKTPSDEEIMGCLGLKHSQFKGLMGDPQFDTADAGTIESTKFMWNIINKIQNNSGLDIVGE